MLSNGENEMKVLIVSPCDLPVPAVKGGAVSVLIQYIIEENEEKKYMDLTVISSYDPEAEKQAKQYLHTKLIYLQKSKNLEYFDKIIDGIRSKDGKEHQYLRKLKVIKELQKHLKENNYDRVVFQNSGYLLNVLKDRKIAEKYEGKLYYHLHNDIPDNISRTAVGQCKLLLISEYLKKHINEVCGRDMSSQCRIVKNGFDCTHFAQELPEREKLALRQKLGITHEKKNCYVCGTHCGSQRNSGTNTSNRRTKPKRYCSYGGGGT